jgi:hypothetical protein
MNQEIIDAILAMVFSNSPFHMFDTSKFINLGHVWIRLICELMKIAYANK